MNDFTPLYSIQELEHALNMASTTSNQSTAKIKVIDRQENIFMSTFHSEIITCQFPDGEFVKLLSKYSDNKKHPDNKNVNENHGHRRRVGYEGKVYRLLLNKTKMTSALFYGAYTDLVNDSSWLFIQYIENSLRVNKCEYSSFLKAAHWIGKFHAINEGTTADNSSWLIKYDKDYYDAWTQRVSLFSKDLIMQYPWINSVCKQFEEYNDVLLNGPLTIIHGEYCPHNILVKDDVIYPVDWESAAIAVGEIDLAMLLDGDTWSLEIKQQCEKEYKQARYPQLSNLLFERILVIAKIYVQMRWLGDTKSWTTDKKVSWRFMELKNLSEQLNSICRNLKTR